MCKIKNPFFFDSEVNEYFSGKLRQLRLGRYPKASQQKIARRLGVTRGTYANYESGLSAIPLWFACAVADYYKMDLEDLVPEPERRRIHAYVTPPHRAADRRREG